MATNTTTPMPPVTVTGATPTPQPLNTAITNLESDLRAEFEEHKAQVKSILATLVAELAAGASNAVPRTQAALDGWIGKL